MLEDDIIDIIIAPEYAWARFPDKYPLGPWMGWSIRDDGTPFIQLGEDSAESVIENALSHEYLHILLYKLDEAQETIDNLWFGHEKYRNIPETIKEYLKGCDHSGIGFPE